MVATILYNAWIFLQIIIGYNLVVPLLLYVVWAIKRKPVAQSNSKNNTAHDYGIIVTAYEQTDAVPAAVDSLLKLHYTNFLIYIVADKCDVSTLKFDDERVIVLRPPETLGSNTRSHFYAIRNFKRAHDVLTIIDSDNLADPDYLDELNKYFDAGFSAVQGVRKAKNLDTTYACLDAARDIYYHFYDGEVLFADGSSATLAGSGMAFKTSLYRECLEHLDVTGAGFDKVLQKEIVSRGYRIAFSGDAVVYDEKTTKSDQLVKQRARWINTWFRYFVFGFSMVGLGVRKANWNQFLFGIILLRPPLFMFLIVSVFCMVANIWISTTALLLWVIGFACFVGGFMLSLSHAKADKRIIRSLTGIPKFVFFQLLSLVKSRKANKISVATQHYSSKNINDVEK